MKKFTASIIAIIFVGVLSSCSNTPSTATETPSKASVATTNAPEVPVADVVPVSWNGTWVTDPAFMSAKIVDDLITINIIADKDTSSLYWQGSWPATAPAKNDSEIRSYADIEALSGSITGSQDKTKQFVYSNGELRFSFSMMGTTKTVHLKK